MIFLIVGDIDEGKTRYLQAFFDEINEGDGFICPKVLEADNIIRYDIRRLSSGEKMPFAAPVDSLPESWDEQCRFGNYSFSAKAIHFAEQIIDELIESKTEPIIIDEIGPLEMENQEGFYNLTKKVIASELGLFISVRRSMADDFEKAFGIEPRMTPITRINIRNEITNN